MKTTGRRKSQNTAKRRKRETEQFREHEGGRVAYRPCFISFVHVVHLMLAVPALHDQKTAIILEYKKQKMQISKDL